MTHQGYHIVLVLGMCFFAGGLKYSEQGFGVSTLTFSEQALCSFLKLFVGATQLNTTLLTISVIAVLLPAAFHFSVAGQLGEEAHAILAVSHGVSELPFSQFWTNENIAGRCYSVIQYVLGPFALISAQL